MQLLELEPGVSTCEVQAESEREPVAPSPATSQKRKHPGRQELPARIIEKSLVSDRIVIDTVVAKYSDHLPRYHQSAMLERETGIEISRATLDGWVLRVGELLLPIVAAMARELVRGSYIQADETPVDVQMHERRARNHQAYLWQYGRPGRQCGV